MSKENKDRAMKNRRKQLLSISLSLVVCLSSLVSLSSCSKKKDKDAKIVTEQGQAEQTEQGQTGQQNTFQKVVVYRNEISDDTGRLTQSIQNNDNTVSNNQSNIEKMNKQRYNKVVDWGLISEDITVDGNATVVGTYKEEVAILDGYEDYVGALEGDYNVNIFSGEVRDRMLSLQGVTMVSAVIATKNICAEHQMDTMDLKLSTNIPKYSEDYNYRMMRLYDNELILDIAINLVDGAVKYKISERN